MSDSYNRIKGYAFEEHIEAFQILMEVFESFGIRYYLIGAQARDVRLLQKGIKPGRGTADIDFAVMIEDMDQYKDLRETLKRRGFKYTNEPYRLVWKKGDTVIDLMPFGEIEQDHTVNFDERDIELSVLGLTELIDGIEQVQLDSEGGMSLPVPPLHGIFMLKLLSWDDKKPGREKDLQDLNFILSNYWDIIEDEAYDKHLDLFDDDFQMEIAAARILGRQLKETLKKSEVLEKRIVQILEREANEQDPPGLMLRSIAGYRDKPITDVQRILIEVLKGIKD